MKDIIDITGCRRKDTIYICIKSFTTLAELMWIYH